MITSARRPAPTARNEAGLPIRIQWLPDLAARLPGLHLPTRIHAQVGQAQQALADLGAANRTGGQ